MLAHAGPGHRRLRRSGRPRLPHAGDGEGERLRRARPQRLERQDQGLRRLVGPARRRRRAAQDLAAQRRPRRPGAAPCGTYKQTENRWFDFWLFGVRNGIMDEPRPTSSARTAPTSTTPTGRCRARAELACTCRPPSATAPGTLATRARGPAAAAVVRRPRPELDTDDVLSSPGRGEPEPAGLPLPAAAQRRRICGTPWVVAADVGRQPHAANLTAVLVDYGPRQHRRR